MKVDAHGHTDKGKVRDYNEDAYLIDEKLGLFIICDGMGGPPHGELACTTAISVIATTVEQNRPLLQAIEQAGDSADTGPAIDMLDQALRIAARRVYQTAQSKSAGVGGCTLAALLLVGRHAVVSHVGDCRVYLVREEQAHPITDDHARMRTGESGKPRKVLSRALGPHEEAEPETLVLELMPRDRFVMLTDGVTTYLEDHELADCCRRMPAPNIAAALVQAANTRGGRDNATAITVGVEAVRLSNVDAASQVKVLKKIPLFAELEYRELARICDVLRFTDYEDGDHIIRDGEEGSDLFIVLSGTAAVMKLDQRVAELTAGAFFGEGGLIEPQGRAADVIAKGNVKVMTIRRSDFIAVLDQNPVMCTKVLWSMCKLLTQRLRKTTGELTWLKGAV
jgi:serine/threonine protein phosphatase PrpC